jgi:hypothetical protein
MHGWQRVMRNMKWLVLLMVPSLASAASVPEATEWTLGLSAERWQLPADETMGVTGLHLRRAFGEHFQLGIDSFAAVQGQRGGFITLGVGGEYRQPLTSHVDLEAGISVSAGGGRGGHELSGGGLLLRENLGLGFPVGSWRWRAGISRVDFPNGGTIAGTQAYAGVERRFRGLSDPLSARDGGFRLLEESIWTPTDIGVYGRQYRVRAGSLTDDGRVQPNFGVVGAEWRGTLSGPWYYAIDAGGAARGQSNGYMEIMGGIGVNLPLSPAWGLDAGVSVGAGGGGAVNTGGGVLLAARLGAQWRFDGRDILAIGYERMKAPDGRLEADGITISMKRRFGPDQIVKVPAHTDMDLESHAVRLRVTEQQYHAASTAWSTRPIPNIGVLGVQADYELSDLWYLTGQGLAAYRGESGAYMTGLIGAGMHRAITSHWQVEAEVLVGAAGGGGVAVASGAVGQVNAGLAYEWANDLGLHASVGRIRSLHGSFAANVIGLSFSYRTTLLSGAR